MVEIWRDIDGYEGLYQVSNFGNVKSLNYNKTGKEKIMKGCNDFYGYLIVGLSKKGKLKHYKVHRLVAQTFIPNPDNLPQVNHKDEDKTNNRVDNLEFCSAKYNTNYGSRTKKATESNINNPKRSKKVLCIDTGVIYPSVRQVERELGFNMALILRVCKGIGKTAYGHQWKFIS